MVTGHTGFVGSWACIFLREIGIRVVGYSLPAADKSIYESSNLQGQFPEFIGDLRDSSALVEFLDFHRPSAVIHLAADALVLQSYENPFAVMDNNFNSTLNLLRRCREYSDIRRILVATTDKVYKNNDTGKKFKEEEPLEGSDPYASSKVAVESLVRGINLATADNKKILIARAGNIIGGGDMSASRLLPDAIRAKLTNENLLIRNPKATRPWQYVLDVLMGYFQYLDLSIGNPNIPSALNFGSSEKSASVEKIIEILKGTTLFSGLESFNLPPVHETSKEMHQLDIDPALARIHLDWEATTSLHESILRTVKWWERIFSEGISPLDSTTMEIENYLTKYAPQATNQ